MTAERPTLTVIVPAFNEVATIATVLRRVLASPVPKQIIVVDDGSRDGMNDVLRQFRDLPEVVILRHEVNRGKGRAIRTGLELAVGRFTIIQDGDLESDPAEYVKLLKPLESGEAQVVYGSRYLGGRNQVGRASFRMGVRLLNLVVRILYGTRITDEATCYKVLPTELLREMCLSCERFEFCPEVTAKVCRMNLTILEIPIGYTPRTIQEGKKVRWRDGVTAIFTLWKFRRWVPPTAGKPSSARLPAAGRMHESRYRDQRVES